MAADDAEVSGSGGAGGTGASFGARLAAAGAAVGELLAVAADGLGGVADEDLAGVMGELTTLVGRLDGLRVAVTAQVRDREVFRRQGAASVTGWLRADVRTADIAASLSQLSARAADLPKVAGLLAEGRVSLAQAGAACWQIARLPSEPRPTDASVAANDPGPEGGAGPEGNGGPLGDDGSEADELWAGLWRRGDVRAAADELFAGFMPRLDGAGLRMLGAHLREAADAQERAGEEYDLHARRCLRMSRGFSGVGELSGRLAPEAAEQVLAAFEELGAKVGPDDPRTKAQRWADVLVYLTGLVIPPPRHGPTPAAQPTPGSGPAPNLTAYATVGPSRESMSKSASGARSVRGAGVPGIGPDAWPGPSGEAEDDLPSLDGGHGHDVLAGSGRVGPSPVAGTAGPGVVPVGLRRPRVIVTVPLSTLLGQPLAPGAVLGAGTPITGEAARRLACDADVIRLITGSPASPPTGPDDPRGTSASGTPGSSPCPCGTSATGPPGHLFGTSDQLSGSSVAHGRVGWGATGALTEVLAGAIAQLPRPLGAPSAMLDIGRSSQSWTPRQRDALHACYGGRCAAPGCSRPIEVIHHIVHWAQGGATTVANGAPFCNFHHWLVHEGGYQAAKEPDGTLILTAPPPGWRPGTIYRHGKPLPEATPRTDAA